MLCIEKIAIDYTGESMVHPHPIRKFYKIFCVKSSFFRLTGGAPGPRLENQIITRCVRAKIFYFVKQY